MGEAKLVVALAAGDAVGNGELGTAAGDGAGLGFLDLALPRPALAAGVALPRDVHVLVGVYPDGLGAQRAGDGPGVLAVGGRTVVGPIGTVGEAEHLVARIALEREKVWASARARLGRELLGRCTAGAHEPRCRHDGTAQCSPKSWNSIAAAAAAADHRSFLLLRSGTVGSLRASEMAVYTTPVKSLWGGREQPLGAAVAAGRRTRGAAAIRPRAGTDATAYSGPYAADK